MYMHVCMYIYMCTLLHVCGQLLKPTTNNRRRYEQFKSLAIEDAKRGARYGFECLFRFYSYGLQDPRRYRDALFADFVACVEMDYAANHLYGLEKFWA
jgi:la-related protein 1